MFGQLENFIRWCVPELACSLLDDTIQANVPHNAIHHEFSQHVRDLLFCRLSCPYINIGISFVDRLVSRVLVIGVCIFAYSAIVAQFIDTVFRVPPSSIVSDLVDNLITFNFDVFPDNSLLYDSIARRSAVEVVIGEEPM